MLKMNKVDKVLESLSKSKFRSSFHLNNKMKEYIAKKGLSKIKSDAYELINSRLAPAYPKNDGKQTPMKQVHPVFIAQHACACCCRSCLDKWHNIKKGKVLSQEEIDYIVNLIMEWINNEIGIYGGSMEKIYIFDMGSVLEKRFNYENFYKELNTSLSYNDFDQIFRENMPFVQRGEITDNEFFRRLINNLSIDMSIDEVKELYISNANGIYDSTKDIIDKLKKSHKKVYLLSDLKEIDYEILSSKYDINNFDKVYLSYKMGYMKNDIRAFKYVIDDLKVKPENILFFDDNKINVDNARKANINAYQVTGDTIEKIFEKYDLFNK